VHNSIHIVPQVMLQDAASLIDIIKQLHVLLQVYVGFIGQAFRIAITEQADTCRQAGMLNTKPGLAWIIGSSTAIQVHVWHHECDIINLS